jgi:hypothetical protein
MEMEMTFGSFFKGALVAVVSFAMLGTVAALWVNPFFIRMTPTSGFEVAFLTLQALLLGVYVAIPVPACAVKLASVGGIANYIGIACPICNKILLFMFGANALLTYLEPVRIYLAAGGALVTMVAVLIRWRNFRAVTSAKAPLSFRDQPPATI